MDPLIHPTTAPHQPDLADDPSRREEMPRVERGWMEVVPRPSRVVRWGRRRDSIAIDAFTVTVALGFVLLMVVLFPLLLLHAYGSATP
jgi:hypothetical protein